MVTLIVGPHCALVVVVVVVVVVEGTARVPFSGFNRLLTRARCILDY
jgi:hypothetical protein